MTQNDQLAECWTVQSIYISVVTNMRVELFGIQSTIFLLFFLFICSIKIIGGRVNIGCRLDSSVKVVFMASTVC